VKAKKVTKLQMSRSSIRTTGIFENIVQIVQGIANGIDQPSAKTIETCISTYVSDKVLAQPDGDTSLIKKDGFSSILSFLGSAIDAVCAVKSYLMAFLNTKIKLFLRRRNYMRLFMQGELSLTKKQIFSWVSDFIKTAANNFVDLGKEAIEIVKSGVKSVTSSVTQLGTKLYNKAVEAVTKLVGPLLEKIEDAKTYLSNLFTSFPFLFEVLPLLSCITNSVAAFKTIGFRILKFIQVLPTLFTTGWIKVLINLLCEWRNLKDGIDALLLAFAGTKIAYNAGVFIGKIIYIISVD